MGHFCLQCGNHLVEFDDAEIVREHCPACGWVYYPHLKVGAAGLVEKDGQLLLARRSYEPWKGYWNLPAGFVEANETPQTAAVREVREETGLEVQAGPLLEAYTCFDDPRGNVLVLVYACRMIGGSLALSNEADQIGFFSKDALPGPLAGAGHQDAVNHWLEGRFGSI